jgi:hypothetical protein
MPESSFYIEDNVRRELYQFLKATGSTIIPDLLYPECQYYKIDAEENFIEYIENKTVRFFIMNSVFSFQDLVLERNRFIEKPSFSIVQRKGGPYINLACYRGYADDSILKVKRTDLHYYSKYINSEDYFQEYAVPDTLKKYYQEISKFIRSKCRKIKIGTKSFYLDINLEVTIKNSL